MYNVYVYIYIYMYIYTHIDTHVYIHKHTHTYTHTHTHTHYSTARDPVHSVLQCLHEGNAATRADVVSARRSRWHWNHCYPDGEGMSKEAYLYQKRPVKRLTKRQLLYRCQSYIKRGLFLSKEACLYQKRPANRPMKRLLLFRWPRFVKRGVYVSKETCKETYRDTTAFQMAKVCQKARICIVSLHIFLRLSTHFFSSLYTFFLSRYHSLFIRRGLF